MNFIAKNKKYTLTINETSCTFGLVNLVKIVANSLILQKKSSKKIDSEILIEQSRAIDLDVRTHATVFQVAHLTESTRVAVILNYCAIEAEGKGGEGRSR